MLIISDLIKELGNYTYSAFLLTVLFCFAFLLVKEDGLREKLECLWKSRKKLMLFFLYLSFLLMAAVFGRPTTNPYKSVLQHLFFKLGDAAWNKEIIQNILVFIPLTFLFLNSFVSVPQKPFSKAVLLGFGVSLFIELSQLVFWLGKFQISDIMWNTLGGILGYAVWLGVTKAKLKLKKKA